MPCRHVAIAREDAMGFSLIELMVTLAILTILTVIAVPGMTGLMSDARLSTQADLLASTLNIARLEAVKQRKDMTVCPMSDPDAGAACSTSAADWSKGFAVYDGTAIIQRVQAKGNVTLTTTATSVVFRGTLGSSSNASAVSFTLCISGKKQQEVDVALSGHVSKKTNSLCT